MDDDVELVELIRDYLVGDGFVVATAHDSVSGAQAALSERYDIVLLDVMMPRMSGLEVLRKIRTSSALPVLLLTARGDDADRIIGLEMGADDYVPKPCTPRELAARIRGILKRTGLGAEQPSLPIVVGDLVVWPARASSRVGRHSARTHQHGIQRSGNLGASSRPDGEQRRAVARGTRETDGAVRSHASTCT